MSLRPIPCRSFPFPWRANAARDAELPGWWWLVLVVAAACLGSGLDSGLAAGQDAESLDDPPKADVASTVHRLWQWDANDDGLLQPDEIPEDFIEDVEHWANLAGFDMTEPVPILALEDAIWAAFDEGEPVLRPRNPFAVADPGDGSGVLGFGAEGDGELIPGFGDDAAGGSGASRADRDTADEWLQRYDRNRDGSIDNGEARRWDVSGDPMRFDENRNRRLDRSELTKMAAEQRNAAAARENRRSQQDSRRQRDQNQRPDQQDDPRQSQRQGSSRNAGRGTSDAESWGLAGTMLNRYDANDNNRLSQTELQNLGEWSLGADANGDGEVDRRELAEWLTENAETTSDALPRSLPAWFRAGDVDGDRQLAMAEFTDEWTVEKAEEFALYDANHDGMMSVEECLARGGATDDSLANNTLRIISPGATVYSEITVSESEPISDLDVRVSITHPEARDLDLFLVDPRGEQVELCTGVGGTRDHFDNTIFDDEAQTSITQGRPPFRGSFRTEAASRRQPGLSEFYDESIEGTWTLMIRAGRSDQPGALHGWALIPKFEE